MDPDMIVEFSNSEECGEWMRGHIEQGDLVLIKGSQGSGENRIRMEYVTKALLVAEDMAPLVLVRQEPEWLKR
jgi:hypothetical protein